MGIGNDGAVGRRLRTLFNVGATGELSDGQLLERFATGRGEAAELAFAALVERHGPMVLRVCRGVLDDPHDSQDAFQATFLVLVAKGRGLWVQDSLGPWLHQVAYRTASCARVNAARRRRLERKAAVDPSSGRPEAVDELGRVLLEEVDRLPERYRAPVVLCDLEGRTHEQAARHLGWPIGTVKSRQARARERLRDRLARRGFAPASGPILAPISLEPPTPALVHSTTLAAARTLASRAIVPGSAAWLSQEVIRSMTLIRWWKIGSVALALGAAGSGVGLLARDGKPAGGPKAQAGRPAGDDATITVRPGKLRVSVLESGVVEPSTTRDVLCEVEGATTIIAIKPEGSVVSKGEVVAELDSATLRDFLVNQRIAVQQAEAALKQAVLAREVAEIAVREYSEGILPQDRGTLTGKIALARSGLKKAEARLERTRRARKSLDDSPYQGPVTPVVVSAQLDVDQRLDEAELEVSRLAGELESAMVALDVLEKHTAPKQVKQLTGEVDRARAAELSKQGAWQLEQAKIKKLERQIERCTLKAPGDGVVLHANDPNGRRVLIEEGGTVRERQLIFRVVDLKAPMRVNVKIPESMVDRIRPGQSARIKVDAIANQELSGSVQVVAPMPDASIRFADGRKVYTTRVNIQDGNKWGLRPGMSAEVEVLVTELDDVLTVPVAAVIRLDEKDRVAVKTPAGAVEWRAVTLGISNDKAVEVKDGLRPGDAVILVPASHVTEEMRRGNPVKPTPPAGPPGP